MDLSDFLVCLPVFKHLDKPTLQALSAELGKKTLPAGAVLFNQGEPGDALYLIESGRMRIQADIEGAGETVINELGAGDCVGEMALLTGQPRNATVTAIEESQVLCLTQSAFDRLSQKYPALLSGMVSQLLPRFQQVQANLALSRLFGKLDDDLLRKLLEKMGWRHLKSGQTLFRQGEPGEEMYIVVQGRLRVVMESDEGPRTMRELAAGECVGEFALLAEPGTPESLRTATIYATRMTDLLVITRQVFEDLLCQYPQVLLNLTRRIVRRVTGSERSVSNAESSFVITLLPTQPGQRLEAFAGQLAEALTGLGPTLLLDSSRFEQLYGKAGAAATPLDHPLSLVINGWLDEREREHACTIYDPSPALDGSGRLTNWAQRCMEDADLLLLVGEAGADPLPGVLEAGLLQIESRARLELALLHPVDCPIPSGTTAWLAPRQAGAFPVQAHHHVRMGNPADFRRLARRITGKPVGLTLAGGGARGWAHLGVMKALEEAGLEVDWIAGASMGAIVAACFALDWSCERLQELAGQFSNPKKLLDYTFPYVSITSTRYITQMLQDLYGDVSIEDTWRPFFCISCNLTNNTERVHTRGFLWKAVRASMAFPGIFAPIYDEGSVLIDGGAINNLPVDRMRAMCPTGTVIGVDLVTSSSVSGEYDFGPSLSGWQALLGRQVKAPNLLNIVGGLVENANRYHLNEVWRCADLLIKVPVQEFGLLEFDKHARIMQAGYLAASQQIKEFQS